MKAILVMILLAAAMVSAQEKPQVKTSKAPDSLVVSSEVLQQSIVAFNKRRQDIQAQMNNLVAEDNQLLGRIQVLQAMLRDSTMQRAPKK